MVISMHKSTCQKDVVKSVKAAIGMAKIEELADNMNYRYAVERAVSNYVGAEGTEHEINLREYDSGEKVEYVGKMEAPLMRSIIKGLGSNRGIESFAVPGEVLSEDAKIILADYIGNNDRLKKVDIGGAINDERSALNFGMALSNNKSLKSVDISGSKFSDSSVKQFAEFLGDNEKIKLVSSDIEENMAARIQDISGKKVYNPQELVDKKVSFSENVEGDNQALKRSGSWREDVGQEGQRDIKIARIG